MRIVITSDVIHPGGAETFILRLANALIKNGHDVTLFILYKNRIDYTYAQSVAPGVEIRHADLFFIWGLQKIDGLLRRLHLDFSLINYLAAKSLRQFAAKNRVDVIHSHLFTADIVAAQAVKKSTVPVVSTIHGDYSAYNRLVEQQKLKTILNFPAKERFVLQQIRKVVCICDEQIQYFRAKAAVYKMDVNIEKVYNGFERPQIENGKVTRASLHIPDEAFVFCMVARGIPEKGWQEAIDAFLKASLKNAYLLLIGGSEYVEGLKTTYQQQSNIKFLGKQDAVFAYMSISDAGLFCSKIKTEALPTVILEYLAANIPVISTDFSESRQMLDAQEGMAGVIVSMEKDRMIPELQNAMIKLQQDASFYQNLKESTTNAFQKFQMDECVKAYEKIYEAAAYPS